MLWGRGWCPSYSGHPCTCCIGESGSHMSPRLHRGISFPTATDLPTGLPLAPKEEKQERAAQFSQFRSQTLPWSVPIPIKVTQNNIYRCLWVSKFTIVQCDQLTFNSSHWNSALLGEESPRLSIAKPTLPKRVKGVDSERAKASTGSENQPSSCLMAMWPFNISSPYVEDTLIWRDGERSHVTRV